MADVVSSLVGAIPSLSEGADAAKLHTALTYLDAIRALLSSSLVGAESSSVAKLLWDDVVLTSYTCLPSKLYHEREAVQYRRCVSDIAVFCCQHGDASFHSAVLDKCVTALGQCCHVCSGSEEKPDAEKIESEVYLPLFYAMEVLEKVPLHEAEMVDYHARLLKPLVDCIHLCPSEVLAFLVTLLLPRVFQLSSPTISSSCRVLWESVSSTSVTSNAGKPHFDYTWQQRSLVVLCSLVQVFLHPSVLADFDLRLQPAFWQLLADSLVASDALCRKQASHLLTNALNSLKNTATTKRNVKLEGAAIFCWEMEKPQCGRAWDDFLLLLTTLEETQAHIVRPVLPRMHSLIAACDEKVMHFTWLAVLLERLFTHELAPFATWAVRVCLESKSLIHGAFLDVANWKFVLGPLPQALLSMDLYSRDHGFAENGMPVVAASLQTCFAELVQLLAPERKITFLCQLLQSLGQLSLTSVPMMYIWNAVASVPSCAAWSEAQLATIGHVVLRAFRTHEVLIRSATQCFMLKSIIKLSDVRRVSLHCAGQMLSTFSSSESLVCGSVIWKEVSVWLRRVADCALNDVSAHNTLDAWQEWLRQLVSSKLNVPTSPSAAASMLDSDTLSVSAVARLVALASDSLHLDFSADESQRWLAGVLSPLSSFLTGMDSRTYLCEQRATTALTLLQGLLDFATKSLEEEDALCCALANVLHDTGSSAVMYLQRRMLCVEECEVVDVASIITNHQILSSIFTFSAAAMTSARLACPSLSAVHSTCYRPLFLSTCITSLRACLSTHQVEASSSKTSALQQLSSLHFLAWLGSVHFDLDGHRREESVCSVNSQQFEEFRLFALSLAEQSVVPPRPSVDAAAQMNNDWGRFGAECVECQWHVLLSVISNIVSSSTAVPCWLGCEAAQLAVSAVNTLAIVGGRASLPILASMRHLLPFIFQGNGALLVSMISACWAVLIEQRDHVLYRSVIATVYHACLLSADVDDVVVDRMHLFSQQVADMADLSLGVLNLVAEHCCSHWVRKLQGSQQERVEASRSLRLHTQLWIRLCTFGPQRNKNIRLENTASLFVESLGDQCPVNLVRSRRARDDRLVRVHGLSVLAALSPNAPEHCELAASLVEALVAFDVSLNNAKMKYSFCSPSHHRKQRLWQACVLLSPMLNEEACAQLAEYIYTVLSTEHQPSVKYMAQWLLVLLLHRFTSLWHSYLQKFREIKSQRLPAMCALLCVSVHMGRLLPAPDQQAFITEALPLIMPWCQSQHNTVRAFALACVDAMWTTCQQAGLGDILQRNAIVQSCVHFSKCNWESMRAKQRICDDFFLATLRPTLDMSLETVFYTVPILTKLVEEEWISVSVFRATWPGSILTAPHRASTWSIENSLDYTELREKKRAELCAVELDERQEPDPIPVSAGSGSAQAHGTDVQQKIRLENLLPTVTDEVRFYEQLRDEHRSGRGKLVLVTSLLEKIPNLGGLCRSCEIFGVSRLVVSSKRILEDKRFTSLSVTSEKWIPVEEVKAADVKDYIRYMRDECGYSIVGVEQTACSRSLESYTFQEKTLLLLGNEREGIPVDLIQMMDDCVEIPQLGIIRSLNVHVSGAILIWEYTKQQIVRRTSHSDT